MAGSGDSKMNVSHCWSLKSSGRRRGATTYRRVENRSLSSCGQRRGVIPSLGFRGLPVRDVSKWSLEGCVGVDQVQKFGKSLPVRGNDEQSTDASNNMV